MGTWGAHAWIHNVTMLSIAFSFTLYFTLHFKITLPHLFSCQKTIPRPSFKTKTETLGIKTKTKTLVFKTKTKTFKDVSRPRPKSRELHVWVQAVLTCRSTGSGFDLACFRSLSSKRKVAAVSVTNCAVLFCRFMRQITRIIFTALVHWLPWWDLRHHSPVRLYIAVIFILTPIRRHYLLLLTIT